MELPAMFDLSSKVALVSGGSRGIGATTAEILAEFGAHVILTSRKAENLEEVQEKIHNAGNQASGMVCHNGDLVEIESLFEKIREKHNRLDILVNNAATNPFYGSIQEVEERAWDKTLDVNLKGPFFMSQHAADLMKKNGGGSIVNVSSINGRIPMLNQSVYSITKAALISMTQAFAKELGRDNIRVNAVLPGLTDTKFASALTQNEELMRNVLQKIPLGRIAKPNEMSGMILFLVSSAASYITGSTFTVDGGMLA